MALSRTLERYMNTKTLVKTAVTLILLGSCPKTR